MPKEAPSPCKRIVISIRRGCVDQPVEFTEAVINGLADGGGLYVPQHIPELTLDEICELAQLPYAQRAARIYKAFGVDLPEQVIDELMAPGLCRQLRR